MTHFFTFTTNDSITKNLNFKSDKASLIHVHIDLLFPTALTITNKKQASTNYIALSLLKKV